MGVYIANFISLFLFASFFGLIKATKKEAVPSLQYQNKVININDLFIGIVAIQLIFISAFRSDNVGIDLPLYIRRFHIILSTGWGDLFHLRKLLDFEYGFIIYNKIIGLLFKNEQAFIIITSFIIVFSFTNFIRNYSKIPWMSLYLFIVIGFYGGSFNILRQYLAISILLFSIKYIINRKPLKFIIILGIAVSFHSTAIIFAILYPLYNKKFNKIDLVIITSIGIILYFFSSKVITFILSFTPYSSYLDDINISGSGESMLLVLMFVLICMIVFKDSIYKIEPKSANLWFHMVIAAIFFNILALDLGLFERVMRYFMVSLIIVIPNTIYSLKSLDIKLIGSIAVIGLTAYYYFKIVMTGYLPSGGIIPYQFFWE